MPHYSPIHGQVYVSTKRFVIAEFDEEDDAINIDDEDGNWPDLEGSDRNDDPQNKTTKGNSNKRKSTEPPNGIQQTYVLQFVNCISL